MGIGKIVLDFLFGKDPEIFNDKGQVQHNLPEMKWKNWHARYADSPEHNWRQHRGRANRSRNSDQRP